MISRADGIHLSSMKKRYQQDKDELYNTVKKPLFENKILEVIEENYAHRLEVINEKFDSLKSQLCYMDYFKYKYDTYGKDYFADEKAKMIIINDKNRLNSKKEKKYDDYSKVGMTDFIKRFYILFNIDILEFVIKRMIRR